MKMEMHQCPGGSSCHSEGQPVECAALEDIDAVYEGLRKGNSNMRRKEKRVRTIANQKATRIKNRPRKAKARVRKAAAVAAKAAAKA
jgi:hypothetical protein